MPVFFDVPDEPPAPRITIRNGTTPIRLALAVIRSGGRLAAGGGLLLVVFNAATMLVPVALGAAIDRGVGAGAIGGFLAWAAVIAGLYALINLTYRFGGRMGWHCVQRAQYELSARVIARLLDVRGIAGRPMLPGRLLALATSDSSLTCSALYFAIYPLGNVVAIVVAAVSLFAVHPGLGVTVAVAAPLLLAVMAVVARPLRARTEHAQENLADASGAAADLVAGHRVITGLQAREAAAGQYRRISRTALRGSLAVTTAEGALIGVNVALSRLFAALVTVVAAGLAFRGSITLGGFVAAAALAQLVLDPIRILVEEAATLGAQVLASARRVLTVLESGPDPAALGTLPVPDEPLLRVTAPGIAFETAGFLAVDLPAADAAAVVAALTLTTSPAAAGVTLGGRPLRDYDPAAVRRAILVAPHHADLLEPTVLANVGDPAALSTACCLDVQHDTPVGDGGRALSGGQRQRVALARAVAREAPVLVLHEPTSSVDAMTELAIAERLRAARRGAATVVLTSSPAFHAVADRSLRAAPP